MTFNLSTPGTKACFRTDSINEFSNLIKQKLSSNLVDVRLFGSVARGTATSDSDIDILVVVLNEDKLTRNIIIDAAVDVNLINDVVISPIIMSKERFKGSLFQETFFYQSVQREGIPL